MRNFLSSEGERLGLLRNKYGTIISLGTSWCAKSSNRWDLRTIAIVIMESNYRQKICAFVLLAKPKIPPIQLTNFLCGLGGLCSGSNQKNLNCMAIQICDGKKSAPQSNSNMGDWKLAQSSIAFEQWSKKSQRIKLKLLFKKNSVYRVITYKSHHDLPVRLNMIFGLQNLAN